jgi:hypothetical protein
MNEIAIDGIFIQPTFLEGNGEELSSMDQKTSEIALEMLESLSLPSAKQSTLLSEKMWIPIASSFDTHEGIEINQKTIEVKDLKNDLHGCQKTQRTAPLMLKQLIPIAYRLNSNPFVPRPSMTTIAPQFRSNASLKQENQQESQHASSKVQSEDNKRSSEAGILQKEGVKRSNLKMAESSFTSLHQRIERDQEKTRDQDKQLYHHQDNDDDDEQHSSDEDRYFIDEIEKVDSITGQQEETSIHQKLGEYAFQESVLSELLQTRVSQLDILSLFLAILKLFITQRDQEKIARRMERELQIEHMMEVVDNFKKQGKWLLMSGIGAGVLGIVSGLAPIVGHLRGGDWILENLSIFEKFQGIKNKAKFFDNVGKMASVGAETQKNIGQVQNTFSEGDRNYHQSSSEIARTEQEECTRKLEETIQEWRNIESFVHQLLQMEYESVRTLYN